MKTPNEHNTMNRYLRCWKCGTAVMTEGEPPLMCTMPMSVRTSGICGGSYEKEITEEEFWTEALTEWLKIREVKDKIPNHDHDLCYCGHTFTCSCGDPDWETFRDSVQRGVVKLGDPNNGWKRE